MTHLLPGRNCNEFYMWIQVILNASNIIEIAQSKHLGHYLLFLWIKKEGIYQNHKKK